MGKSRLSVGDETYMSKDGTFHGFAGGETVFSSLQTEALWNLSKNLTDNLRISPVDVGTLRGNEDNSVTLHGDIIVQNPADFNDFTQKLTDAFRRKNV